MAANAQGSRNKYRT